MMTLHYFQMLQAVVDGSSTFASVKFRSVDRSAELSIASACCSSLHSRQIPSATKTLDSILFASMLASLARHARTACTETVALSSRAFSSESSGPGAALNMNRGYIYPLYCCMDVRA